MLDGTYVIGRGAPSGARRRSSIRLDDPTVSERHAELFVLNGTYYITDLQSRNGTWRIGDNGDERLKEGYVDLDERLRFGEAATTVRDLLNLLPA